MIDLTSPSIVRENRELACELKFLITPDVAEGVREWARHKLLPDPYGNGDEHEEYKNTSLYFETDTFDVFNRKGSYGRSKYRIRRYGTDELVFLERKLKTNGLVAKRRSPSVTREIKRLSDMQPDPKWLGSWDHRRGRLRKTRAICKLCHER